MKDLGPVEVMDELIRRTKATRPTKPQTPTRPDRRSEIGGLLLIGIGGIVAVVSFLATALNWYGLIAVGSALFGLLLMKEGYEIRSS